jgi:hypothetical protein
MSFDGGSPQAVTPSGRTVVSHLDIGFGGLGFDAATRSYSPLPPSI